MSVTAVTPWDGGDLPPAVDLMPAFPAPLASLPALPPASDLPPASFQSAFLAILSSCFKQHQPLTAGEFYSAVANGPYASLLPAIDSFAAFPDLSPAAYEVFQQSAASPPHYIFINFQHCVAPIGAPWVRIASHSFILSTPSGLLAALFDADDASWQYIKLTDTQLLLLAQTTESSSSILSSLQYVVQCGSSIKLFPASALLANNGNNLPAMLASAGIKFSWQHRALLASYFAAASPPHSAETISESGWTSDFSAFCLGAAILRPEGSNASNATNVNSVPLQISSLKPFPQGSAEFPHEMLASLRPSWLRLACYASLAAPLLRKLSLQGFTLHLHGRTTTGKTTALELATACWASFAPHASHETPFLASWNTTGRALEELCLQHNDLPLPLDEIRTASPEVLEQATYAIANGQGRSRLTSTSSLIPVQSWRTIAISSGELCLSDILRTVHGGQLVRFLELPIPATQHIPFLETLKASLCAASLSSRPGPAFIEYLAMQSNESLACAFVQSCEAVASLASQYPNSQKLNRVLRHIALLHLTASLATASGCLPPAWSPDILTDLSPLLAASADATTTSDFITSCEALQNFLAANFDSKILPLGSTSQYRELAGWYTVAPCPENENLQTYNIVYLLASALRTALGDAALRLWLAEARASGILLASPTASRYTVKAPAACKGRPWVYALQYSRLQETLTPQ